MKYPTVYSLSILVIVFLGFGGTALARPIDFSELSLLVRAHESESAIVQQVSQRKLLHKLTQQQESTLKSQGASDSLVRSLRNSNVVSKEEAAAIEAKREEKAKPVSADRYPGKHSEPAANISVFEVAVDHPVNLTQWGGPDYEFTFSSQRWLGGNVVTPFMTNQAGTYTDVATYVGFGATGWEWTPSEYVAVVSHATNRPIPIDMQNPVRIKGVPYALYPVYGAGGVSLYYIGATTYSVKLAVSTRWR
jgi:hypothetical protein